MLGCSAGGDCVCLAGVKKKERANRLCPVSAPRLGETRGGDEVNAVAGRGGGEASLGWVGMFLV